MTEFIVHAHSWKGSSHSALSLTLDFDQKHAWFSRLTA